MKAVAIIPARGGSKRIPRKNIKDFFGKPLIAYSIQTALESNLFEKVIVSTDDNEIADIAREYGAEVPFIRPPELADDFTVTQDVIEHTLAYLKSRGQAYECYCTIYATAPLLQSKYLLEGYKKLKETDTINVFSATSMPFPIQRTFKINDDGRCEMFYPEHFVTRSQDLEEAYQDAGQFYWSKIGEKSDEIMFGRNSIPIILPRHLVQDIDTKEDWQRAEFIYNSLNQKKTNILFRADSSSNIGIGHIMRDLVLAKQYPDASITFATLPLKGNINNKILDAGHNVVHLLSNNKKELVSLIKELQIDLLIIDHYDINYEIEKYIKEKTEVKIFILDDTYEKHYCDILLNHNIGANEKKYKTLIPKSCELRCGGNYTLLRDEFYKEKYRKYKKNNNITKIFIAMGGTDSANLNVKILKILKLFENLQVNLITTSSNKNLKDLRNYIKNKKWIKLHVDSKSIAKLMKKSNFAILTPSVSVNEAYFMNLPFIAIKTAKNQEYLCKYLKKKKYMVIDKFKKNKLAQFIQMILVSKNSKIALIEGV